MLFSGATSDVEVVSRRRSRHSLLHRSLAVDAALVPKHGRQRTQARHKDNARMYKISRWWLFHVEHVLFPKISKRNTIRRLSRSVQVFPIQSRSCSKQLSFLPPCSMASLQLLTRPRPMRCVGGVQSDMTDPNQIASVDPADPASIF